MTVMSSHDIADAEAARADPSHVARLAQSLDRAERIIRHEVTRAATEVTRLLAGAAAARVEDTGVPAAPAVRRR